MSGRPPAGPLPARAEEKYAEAGPLSTICFQSRGAAGDVDLSFDPDSPVALNGTNCTYNKFARLNANGSLDASFHNPVVSGSSKMKIQLTWKPT